MGKEKDPTPDPQLAKTASQLETLMQQMQSEFTSMCKLKREMAAKCSALDVLIPDLEDMKDHMVTLREHVETLMKEREEQNAALLHTISPVLRPSVDSKPTPEKIDACWEAGSRPQTIGMETDPRDRDKRYDLPTLPK